MGIQIEVELFKNEKPIDLPEECDENHYTSVVRGTQLQFDKGIADRAVLYIAHNGELIDIITRSPQDFSIEDIDKCIKECKEKFGA
jgi:hypothetical protein